LAGVFSGRQRLQAAVVTGAMLAVVGLSWFGDREPPDVATAQAAGVTGGVAPAIRHGVACKVRYQVRRDSGGSFTARLTVVNTGSRPIAGWRLEFAYPGGQRLTRAGKSVTQRGRTVLIRSHAPRPLAPGRSSVTTLRGDYRDMNPLPLAFALNGHPCLAEVLGATSADTPDVSADTDPRQVTEAAGAERPAGAGAGAGAGDGGGPGRRDDQTRSRQKAKPDKSRPQPHPDVTTAPPPAKGIGHTTSV
jgi:serine/threonine-protein kinase